MLIINIKNNSLNLLGHSVLVVLPVFTVITCFEINQSCLEYSGCKCIIKKEISTLNLLKLQVSALYPVSTVKACFEFYQSCLQY